MNIFRRNTIHFSAPDPLANGLGDEIAAEQREADAINIMNDTNAEELASFWNSVIQDAKKDGDWVDFAED